MELGFRNVTITLTEAFAFVRVLQKGWMRVDNYRGWCGKNFEIKVLKYCK